MSAELPSERLPHSRACGFVPHEHGPRCHSNCPSCHGRPMAPTVGAELPSERVPLVDRLRDDAFQCFTAATPGTRQYIGELLIEAADEIERLRGEIADFHVRGAAMTAELASERGPVICDECGRPVQIICLIGDPSSEAVRALLVAAHKRFHAEDRALAEAQRKAAYRAGRIGPLAATTPATSEEARDGR